MRKGIKVLEYEIEGFQARLEKLIEKMPKNLEPLKDLGALSDHDLMLKYGVWFRGLLKNPSYQTIVVSYLHNASEVEQLKALLPSKDCVDVEIPEEIDLIIEKYVKYLIG